MTIDELVKIGFTLSQATDLSVFFGNVAYVGDFDTADLQSGVTVPDTGTSISKIDTLKTILKEDTQYYLDIEAILTQKNNTSPNQSEVKNVILFQKKSTDASFKVAFERAMTSNANFSQVSISSRLVADIEGVADSCLANNRLGEFQTADTDISSNATSNLAKTLRDKNNYNTKISFDSDNASPLSPAIMSIQAGSKFGKNGDIYSTLSGVLPKTYSSTIENNLKALNVAFYSYINPINGGGVDQYASKLYFVGKMINGENAKRRRIRFYLDITLKAMGLDFLKKKLNYKDSSCAVLESMMSSIFIECASNEQVAKNEKDEADFYFNVLSIADTKKYYNSLYLTQTYKCKGWYRDALTGEMIDIELSVDPTDAEKKLIEVI